MQLSDIVNLIASHLNMLVSGEIQPHVSTPHESLNTQRMLHSFFIKANVHASSVFIVIRHVAPHF